MHPEGLSTTGQGEAEEGEVSRNDQVTLPYEYLSFELSFLSDKYYSSFLLLLLAAVFEEASHAGESYRGGEASYQAILPEERHQQG